MAFLKQDNRIYYEKLQSIFLVVNLKCILQIGQVYNMQT